MNPLTSVRRWWSEFFAVSPCPVTGEPCCYKAAPGEPKGMLVCRDCGWFDHVDG